MSRCIWLLIALILAPVTARAANGPETQLTWRLQFGAGAVTTGYGLAFGYRRGERADLRLLELDISDRAALARLAGLPLLARDYRMAQDEGLAPVGAAEQTPWYARQWVWWTVGGIAATAAVGGGSGETATTCTGICNQQSTGNGVTVTDDGACVADENCAEPPCPPGSSVCVACDGSLVGGDCNQWTARRSGLEFTARDREPQWLIEATGWMGDLLPR